jgi:transposase
MNSSIHLLPDDPILLKRLLAEKDHAMNLMKLDLDYMEEIVKLFYFKQFAPKSERWAGQALLFNETEVDVDKSEKQESDERKVESYTRKARATKTAIPDIVPRVDQYYDLKDSEKQCSCGCMLKEIGEELSEQLNIIPAIIQVIRHHRKKYCCQNCDGVFKTASMPAQPIPKSMAAPGLLAYVATAKYADHLPLYRQESIFSRSGINLARNTLANWMIKVSELLVPLTNLMHEKLLEGPFIQMDETTVQVLKEKDRKPTTKSYMWVQTRDGPDDKIVLFHYDPSRSAGVAKDLLGGFKGKILTDGYEAYGAVAHHCELVHHGCWDHARRKFFESYKGQKQNAPSVAAHGLNLIKKLYKIERVYKDSSAEERLNGRLENAKPVIEEMRTWLDNVIDKVQPRSLTGQALYYLNSQWEKLVRFLEDGSVPISNALAENAIRPFAIGRKNWLFSDTPRGAHASATIYSIIETAKANGIEPYHYLTHILTEIPKAKMLEDFEQLLPPAVRKKLAH